MNSRRATAALLWVVAAYVLAILIGIAADREDERIRVEDALIGAPR